LAANDFYLSPFLGVALMGATHNKSLVSGEVQRSRDF
jgi:hypothetical protein